MKLPLEVIYTANPDQTVVVIAAPVDMVAFERHHGKGVGKVLTEDQKFEDICWLAWYTTRRRKQTALDFDPWLEGVDSVSVHEDETAPLASTP